MATVITEECINCGACEPECPNTAIYEGGAPWELDGKTGAAIQQDIYYIVPDKCTECVGFFDQEQCAAVCPVDCCIPDPKIPETEEVSDRAREKTASRADLRRRFSLALQKSLKSELWQPAAPKKDNVRIAPANGKLGVLMPGMGAVAPPSSPASRR